MKNYLFVFACSVFLICVSVTQAQDNEPMTSTQEISMEKVEVYYFHNTRRCATCQSVETVTKSSLDELYPEQIKEGKITFVSLDIEDDANEELAKNLKVSGQSLLIIKNGKQKDLTNDAFMYARSNPEKLKEKIKKAIDTI